MQLFNQIILDNIEYKKYKNHQIISKENFNQYRKELEKQNKYVSIIRNTKLKEIDKDEIDEYADVLFIDDAYYELQETKEQFTVGYIAIDIDKFIRVTHVPFILVLFLLLLLSLSLLLFLNTKEPNNNNNIKLDNSAIDWDGENPNTKETNTQKNIEIPGFYKFVATKNKTSVPLYNPNDNTVYFTYSIYEIIDSNVVQTFDSEIDAQQYIRNNEIIYREEKDLENNIYKLIEENTENVLDLVPYFKIVQSENKYDVVQENIRIINYTDMIAPGKQVLWNPYEYLESGSYNFRFKIRTFDIETGAECYGGFLAVEGIVE